MQAGFVRLRSEEHAVQRSENARKNSFLNYFLAKSFASAGNRTQLWRVNVQKRSRGPGVIHLNQRADGIRNRFAVFPTANRQTNPS
jgi:hypothetical protein